MGRKSYQKKVTRKNYSSKYVSNLNSGYDRMAVEPILKFEHGFTRNSISFIRGDVVVTKNVLNSENDYGFDDMLFKEYRPFLIIRSNPMTNNYTAVPITSHYPNKTLVRTHQRLVSIPPIMPDVVANYADLSCVMTFRLEDIIGKIGYMEDSIVDGVEAAGIFYSCRYCESPLERLENIIHILEDLSKDGNAIAKFSSNSAPKYRDRVDHINDILNNEEDETEEIEEEITEFEKKADEETDELKEDTVEETPEISVKTFDKEIKAPIDCEPEVNVEEGEPFDPDAPENAMALEMWKQMQKHASMKKFDKNLKDDDIKILEVKEEPKPAKRQYGRTPKISSIDIALKFYHDIYDKASTAVEAANLLGISTSSEVVFRQTLNVILYKEFGTKFYIQYSRGKNSKRIPPEEANIDITKLKILSSRIKLSDKK